MSNGRVRRSSERQQNSQKRFVLTMAIMSMATIFFGMQLMMVGPLKRSLESIQSRLDLTEMDMRKLVSARNQVWQSNDLLSSLQEQHAGLAAARETLVQIQQLQTEVTSKSAATADALAALDSIANMQQKLIAQTETTRVALTELDQLIGIKDSLVADAGQTPTALESLAALHNVRQTAIAAGDKVDVAYNNVVALTGIKDTVVNGSENVTAAEQNLQQLVALKDGINDGTIDVDAASETGQKLVALNNQLVTEANVDVASENASRLIALGTSLSDDDIDVQSAQQNLASLVSIQNSLTARSTDIASAVESLEIMADFKTDIDQHIRSLDGVRRTMMEIVMLESTVGRAARILRPLVELGNLRRLSDGEVRQAAKAILADRTTRLSQKQTDLQGAREGESSVDEFDQDEQLVPHPRDVENEEDI